MGGVRGKCWRTSIDALKGKWRGGGAQQEQEWGEKGGADGNDWAATAGKEAVREGTSREGSSKATSLK